MIVGLLGTQNGTTEDMHQWEATVYRLFADHCSHFRLHIDVFEGDEKVIEESDVIILFHKVDDPKTIKLLDECVAKKKTFICVVSKEGKNNNGGLQKVTEKADPKIRNNTSRSKSFLKRIKR